MRSHLYTIATYIGLRFFETKLLRSRVGIESLYHKKRSPPRTVAIDRVPCLVHAKLDGNLAELKSLLHNRRSRLHSVSIHTRYVLCPTTFEDYQAGEVVLVERRLIPSLLELVTLLLLTGNAVENHIAPSYLKHLLTPS